ncbi:MAG: PP0621 family protein [Burkholderiaceae bacterium]
MKLLVLLAVGLLLVWLWRSGRKKAAPPAPKAKSPGASDMVRCPVCAVHVPSSDAIHGKLGGYCSEAHRLTVEPPQNPP